MDRDLTFNLEPRITPRPTIQPQATSLPQTDAHDAQWDASQLLPGEKFTPDLNTLRGRYRLRFARTEGDLHAVQRLRYEVFNLELNEGLAESRVTGLDQDRFDHQFQHLMVTEEATGEVVGTYRLQVSESAAAGEGFYSNQEFDLSALPAEVLRDSVELGRACVARAHRDKRVLFVLWAGLTTYLRWNSKRYFFGCSSLTSQDPHEGISAYMQLLERGSVWKEFVVTPRAGWECELKDEPLHSLNVKIPALFAIYMRYGAKVCGPPAIDREFKTIDFLTLFDLAQISDQMRESIRRGGL